MPTHTDLLSAEIAFILYNGQVYMSHPTDNDVSLPKLVHQIGILGHLDEPLVHDIQSFLHGAPPPRDLQLVGRYNMTNGRMAPYGPVNSPENQELVRQAIQQAAYNAPVSSPDGSGDDPARLAGTDIKVDVNWRTARQFMPLVDKVGHDTCPFCRQKRSLYHMKDGYLAQAMGIYGHGLCRDCLTTRMDQHEMTTGTEIAPKVSKRGFRRVAANVEELFLKTYRRVWDTQLGPYFKNLTEVDKARSQRQSVWILQVLDSLRRQAPETYKLLPWLARTLTKDRNNFPDIMMNGPQHLTDILQQAQAHLDRLRDDPRAEVQVPDVMRDFKGEGAFRQLERWVYDQTAAQMEGDVAHAEKTVYDWPDGWTIKQLGAEALGKEGEQMGHCVGGQGYCNGVEAGDTLIYSLRDEKNQPHATIEVEGQHVYHRPSGNQQFQQVQRPPLTAPQEGYTPFQDEGWTPWEVVQIQGKEDSEPIPAYRQRINQWMTSLRNQGVDIEWSDNAIRPGSQGESDEDYVSDLDDVMKYWEGYGEQGLGHHYPSEIGKQDQQYDPYGLPHNNWGTVWCSDIGDFPKTAAAQYVQGDDNWHRSRKLDLDPDELAEALVFLAMQLDIQDQKEIDDSGHQRNPKSLTNMEMLTRGWEEADQWVNEQIEEMREMNWEWHSDSIANAFNEDAYGLNKEGEPDGSNLEHWDEEENGPKPLTYDERDPDDMLEHPTVEKAESDLYDEYARPFKESQEFLQSLHDKLYKASKGEWTTAPPEFYQSQPPIRAPHGPQPETQPATPAQPTDIPGTLGKWRLTNSH